MNILGGRARVEREKVQEMEKTHFGDNMEEKSTNALWLVSQNYNGI